MKIPNCDGHWRLERNKGKPSYLQMEAIVNLAKEEVQLPTSEHPYRLADLIGDDFEWTPITGEGK
jgi:hypothetical protein